MLDFIINKVLELSKTEYTVLNVVLTFCATNVKKCFNK